MPTCTRTWVLPATFALLLGCDEDGGCACDTCDAAVDHMAARIASQGCDPGRMDKARDKINDDCEENPAWVIGAVVEECNAFAYGHDPVAVAPACREWGQWVSFPVVLTYDNSTLSAPDLVNVDAIASGKRQVFRELSPGQSITVVLEVLEGDEVVFDFLDAYLESDFFVRGEEVFEVDTTRAAWTSYRQREVILAESAGVPYVSFVNW